MMDDSLFLQIYRFSHIDMIPIMSVLNNSPVDIIDVHIKRIMEDDDERRSTHYGFDGSVQRNDHADPDLLSAYL